MDEGYYCGHRWMPDPSDAEPDDWHECAIPKWRHQDRPHKCSCNATEPTVRCPGCDCDPVGYAPHNGKGDCPPIHMGGSAS